jgi:xanthine dehydrogenase small subunit
MEAGGHSERVKRDQIVFYLNGEKREVGAGQAGMMLADYLRYERGLTGTKIVCAEGDCGACSVLRFFPYGEKGFAAVNACILTVAQIDGSSLVTVDALAEEKLTPVQEAMVSCNGSQCGFCTPGFVVTLSGLVEKKKAKREDGISEKEAKNALTGNLCRCTGYQPILDAAVAISLKDCKPLAPRFLTPAILRELKRVVASPLELKGEDFFFYAPTNLAELRKCLTIKNLQMIGAGTDLGVQHNKRRIRLKRLLSLHLVAELYDCGKKSGRIRVGARVTLTALRRQMKDSEFGRFLDLFASPQIKNVATLVGNVCNASPIADTPPFLLALDAVAHLLGPKGKRAVPLSEFFLGYRKTALRPGECMVALEFPLPAKNEKLALYKSSQRKDLDISAVNAAFRLRFEGKKISEARIVLGGVAATAVRLASVEAALLGRSLSSELSETAVALLQKEIHPISDLRGSAALRRVLAGNFLRRFLRAAE